jgi:hypothetical protein
MRQPVEVVLADDARPVPAGHPDPAGHPGTGGHASMTRAVSARELAEAIRAVAAGSRAVAADWRRPHWPCARGWSASRTPGLGAPHP